jgi:hypothetical protein
MDISFAVSVVSRFMQDPRESHWKDEKCIVRYLKGTSILASSIVKELTCWLATLDLTRMVMEMIENDISLTTYLT